MLTVTVAIQDIMVGIGRPKLLATSKTATGIRAFFYFESSADHFVVTDPKTKVFLIYKYMQLALFLIKVFLYFFFIFSLFFIIFALFVSTVSWASRVASNL